MLRIGVTRPQWSSVKAVQRCFPLILILGTCVRNSHQAKLFNKSLAFLPQSQTRNVHSVQASVKLDSPIYPQTENENRSNYDTGESLPHEVLDQNSRGIAVKKIGQPPLSLYGSVSQKADNDKEPKGKGQSAFLGDRGQNTLSIDGKESSPGYKKGVAESLCPPCKCFRSRGRETADCSNLQLLEIPETLPHRISSLNMSFNHVALFNITYLSAYPYLQNIDFQNNAIGTFEKDIYHTSQLISLNLRNNSVTQLQNINCESFPKLQTLILSKNDISHLPSSAFENCKLLTHLDLSDNRITSIDSSAFDSLSNLLTLSLAFNDDLEYTVFTPELFGPLHSLRHLEIQGCSLDNYKRQYPNEALASISGLVELSIDGLGGGAEFGKAMNNLTHLETVNISPESICLIQEISPSFFENIRYVKSVSFYGCLFSHIDPNALMVLRNLEAYAITAPLSYSLIQAFEDIKGLQNSSLKYLRLALFSKRSTPCVALTSRESRYIRDFPLEELDLRDNYLAEVDDFLQGVQSTLQILRLQRNKFNNFDHLYGGMASFTALQLLDISSQNTEDTFYGIENDRLRRFSSGFIKRRDENEHYLQRLLSNKDSYFPRSGEWEIYDTFQNEETFSDQEFLLNAAEDGEDNDDEESASKFADSEIVPLPPNLTTLISSRFPYDALKLFTYHIGSQRLKKVYLSNSVLIDWGEGVMPDTIELADLSYNYCNNLKPSFFPANNSLIRLFIQGNYLGPVLTGDLNGDIFAKAKRIQVLDMSQNIIFNLPKKFLKGLKSLQTLVLAENKLHIIDTDFSHTPNLRFLDLSRNSIIWISRASRRDLDVIRSRHVIKMDLSYNPLPCTCDGIELLRWLLTTNIDLLNVDRMTCSSHNRKVKELMGDIQRKINDLESQCASKYFVMISAFFGVALLLIITVALLYRHRWKLIYMRNVWLVKLYGFRPMGNTATGRAYDAYVVYSQEDRGFALDTMLEELEEKRGHRLCVEDRNFIPGSFIFNNITCAVQNSTVTLLLVSSDFLRDKELEYAVQMALMEEYSGGSERDVLLLLNYKSADRTNMSKDLLLLMSKGRFLDFPGLGEEEQEGDEVPESTIQAFWDTLSREIGHVENRHTTLFVNGDGPVDQSVENEPSFLS